MAMPRIRTAPTPTPFTVPGSGRNVEDCRRRVAPVARGCPQVCPKFVAAVDFVGHRTYVRSMQAASGDGWWEDDCPLPDDREPVDALDEVVRSDRTHNAVEGHRAQWVLQLLRETTPVGGISPRDQVAAEIGAALRLGSGAATTLVDVSVALHERLPATLRAVCGGSLS